MKRSCVSLSDYLMLVQKKIGLFIIQHFVCFFFVLFFLNIQTILMSSVYALHCLLFLFIFCFFLRVHLLFCCFFLTTRWNQGSRLSFYTAIILSPGRDISHRRNAFLMACQSCQPPPTGKKLSQPKVVYSIDLRRTSKLDARQIIRKIKLFIYKVISSVTLSLNFLNRNQHTHTKWSHFWLNDFLKFLKIRANTLLFFDVMNHQLFVCVLFFHFPLPYFILFVCTYRMLTCLSMAFESSYCYTARLNDEDKWPAKHKRTPVKVHRGEETFNTVLTLGKL